MILLVPALNPSKELLGFLREVDPSIFKAIILVDDGSDAESQPLFQEASRLPRVVLFQHAVNLGKGAALKSGLNLAKCQYPEEVGVITADADGQHRPEDILSVALALERHPQSLILGTRAFPREVPWRSRIGNRATRAFFSLLMGMRLADTQTGLRGIPMALVPKLLKIEPSGYEFELEMLLACKHENRQVEEVPIATVYLDQNRASHFNPLLDSMKIWLVLFRFFLSSLATAVFDFLIFSSVIASGGRLAAAQASARGLAMVFNYLVVKKLVFYSDQRHRQVLPWYLLLVAVSGTLSFGIMRSLSHYLHLDIRLAKVAAESLLFLANFTIQRDFIFKSKG